MADEVDKKPIEAPGDEPRFASNEVTPNEADQALAAMGYNPVSLVLGSPLRAHLTGLSPPTGFQTRIWKMVRL